MVMDINSLAPENDYHFIRNICKYIGMVSIKNIYIYGLCAWIWKITTTEY